jgi:hypothetical protein
MNTFRVKVTSQSGAALAIFICIILFFPLMILRNKYLPIPLGTVSAILMLIPIIIFFIFIFRKIAAGKTEWQIDNQGISIHWVKHFAFSSNQDIQIKWIDIDTYKKRFDPMYYTFKIKLVSGQVIKFYRSTGVLVGGSWGDDFLEMADVFARYYNEKKLSSG